MVAALGACCCAWSPHWVPVACVHAARWGGRGAFEWECLWSFGVFGGVSKYAAVVIQSAGARTTAADHSASLMDFREA
eukprot:2884457-Lingulodinium_polyedra.AAC.1